MLSTEITPLVKWALIVCSCLGVIGGVYLWGKSDGKEAIRQEIAADKKKWEEKVGKEKEELRKQFAQVTADYKAKETLYQKEIAKLKGGKVVTQYIPESVDTLVPKGLVELHNLSAQGKELTGEGVDFSAQSNINLSRFGYTLAKNYYSCNTTITRLEALQSVVKQFQEKQEELTK